MDAAGRRPAPIPLGTFAPLDHDRIHADMTALYHRLLGQFGKLSLVFEYFKAIAKEWMDILFGYTVLAVLFLLWWALANPPNSRLIIAFVVAMFIAGYYAWRSEHVRLTPKFEVTQFTRQTIDTFDQTGKKNGWSEYFQILRCLTEANVEQCRGLLTSIEMLDRFSHGWKPVEEEVMFLEWSHGDATPITLYPHAENRLNVFYLHSCNREIRPCVLPYPVRFITLFNQLQLRQVSAGPWRLFRS
jgi:hypothetical protein